MSRRPLGLPRPTLWLIWAVLAVLGVPVIAMLVALLANGWFALTLLPLQRYYLPAYTDSAFRGSEPQARTRIEWLLKTAPGRPSTLAGSSDVVAGPGKLGVRLSEAAVAAGWRGVAKSAPERDPAAELAPLLQEAVYGGQGAWLLLSVPAGLCLAGLATLCLFGVMAQRRWGWEVSLWRADRAQERRHGRRTKGPELVPPAGRWLGRYLGQGGGIQLRLRGEHPWSPLLPFGPSYRVPRRLESSHILLMGDTGAGKSSAIRQILGQVRARGESAIVYDPAMDFVGEFYSPERGDLILNPLDARCPYWSLGDEIDRPETAAAMAAAFLPEKEYEKAFFTDSPRRILAHLLQRKPQPRDILRMMADPERIEWAVKGTPLASLVDPAAPAQRAGVISSLNMVADSFELLPEWEHRRPCFSTADWQTERKRWVFLTSSPAYREKTLPLHSVWLDLLILRMMGRCEDENAKPVWFVLDELASLNKLPQLHTAVTENRKYGNPVVLGFQGRSQMEKRYGQDAEAMLSQPATKVFFKTSEPRAAKWVSEAIGEIEVERIKESRTPGLLGSKRSYAMEIATKPLVMASEIAGLAPLRAFIKQENRVMPVWFRLAKKRGKQLEFIERVMPKPTPRVKEEPQQIPAMPVAPVRKKAAPRSPVAPPPAPAVPKKAAASQGTLPLAPVAAAKPKAAFVWDESKGID